MAELFMSIKMVQKITNISHSTAQRKLAEVRTFYNIDKYKSVTVEEYCKYYRLDMEMVMKLMEKG